MNEYSFTTSVLALSHELNVASCQQFCQEGPCLWWLHLTMISGLLRQATCTRAGNGSRYGHGSTCRPQLLLLQCRCCGRTKTRSIRPLKTVPPDRARAGVTPRTLLQPPALAGSALEVSTRDKPQHCSLLSHACHSSYVCIILSCLSAFIGAVKPCKACTADQQAMSQKCHVLSPDSLACAAAAGAASRSSAPKAHPSAHRSNEPQQRLRTQPKAQQPQSPPAPPLSASMNPAVHAKLQQAHNKMLAQSARGPRQQDDTASVARPSSAKPGSKKGRAAAQQEPTAGAFANIKHTLTLPTTVVHCTSLLCLAQKPLQSSVQQPYNH